MSKVYRPGLYDIPEDAYRSDTDVLAPALGRSLSHSGAVTLVQSCPRMFQHEREFGRPARPAYDYGHAAHKYVLGKGADVVRIDADDWRTAAARAERDNAYELGRIPMLARDDDKAQGLARTVLDHPGIGPWFRGGDAEVSAYGVDPVTGVTLRARFDYLRQNAIIDLKTTRDPNPRKWIRSATDYGYPVQAWWYPYVHRLATGEDLPLYFVAVGSEPPHLITAFRPTRRVLEYGEARAREAIETYAQCVSDGSWPGWDNEIHDFDLPPWVA